MTEKNKDAPKAPVIKKNPQPLREDVHGYKDSAGGDIARRKHRAKMAKKVSNTYTPPSKPPKKR